MKPSKPLVRGLLGDDPPSKETILSHSPAFAGLRPGDEKARGRLPEKLKLDIIKEEAYRAKINYLWHPKYRKYAQTPGNYPYSYEEFYNDPKNRDTRDREVRQLSPYSSPQPIKKLLAMHPEMHKYWGNVGEDVRLSQGELVARHNYLLKELGEEDDPKWGPYHSYKDKELVMKAYLSGRELTREEPATPDPLWYAQNERAEIRSDATPARPGPEQDKPDEPHRLPARRDRTNDTWKKIQARKKEEEIVRAAAEKRMAEEARAKSNTPSWPKDLGSTGWADGRPKPAEERPKPQWQILSDDYVEKNRRNDAVAAIVHAGKFDSRTVLSMDKLQDRAMDLEAEKAGIKPGDHPYRNGVSRDDPEARDFFTGRLKIKSPPLFGDRREFHDNRKKIAPHLKKESVYDHLAKDKYKHLAWMYKDFSKGELANFSKFKMTESEFEACYEHRKRLEIEAEQARKHSVLHSAAKPHSLVSTGTSAVVSGVGKVAGPVAGAGFGAFFGGAGVELDRQISEEYLHKIGIRTAPVASWEDIGWGAVNGAVGIAPKVGLPATSTIQIFRDNVPDEGIKK